MIAALLRAQWLSMQAFRWGTRRRGVIFAVFTAFIWYGFWLLLALGAAAFTANPEARNVIEIALPKGLLFIFLYWQLAPMLTASMGASLEIKKLLVYPIPQSRLFLLEVLLRLSTAPEMLLLLAGSFIGLACNPAFGGWAAALARIPPYLGFVTFNLLLTAGLRNLIERLLSHKRLREVLVLLMISVWTLPQLLLVFGIRNEAVRRLFMENPNPVWPWAATIQLALHGYGGWGWPTLAAWTAAAYWFGRWQFARSLRFDVQAAQATEVAGRRAAEEPWIERLYRLPALPLPDPLGAIVEKELRSLARAPRFRLVFIMGFSFGLLVWLPMALGHRGSAVAENFLTIVSIYALTLLGQVSYWNCFGFDRSAAQAYYLWPVSISKTLVAKNIAAGLFVLLEMLAVTAACVILRVNTPPGKILEAYAVTLVAALYLLATGNLSSVHFPKPMNPERVGRGSAAGRLQAVMFLVYPLALLPVGLAFLAQYAFESDIAFYAMLALAGILGAVVYWIALESAVQVAVRRREAIVAELSAGEGPVVAG